MGLDLDPIFLSIKLAFITTSVLLFIGIPLAYWLAFSKSWLAGLVAPLVSMPLVLPPTVLGFYLLLLLSPNSFLGGWIESAFGLRVVFTFVGLVVGSIVFSLPFMVNPVKSGFESIPPALVESSYTLGKSNWETFIKVLIPNNCSAILTGVVMSFAHTIGEFGVVLMIGGNIPEETRLASIAIYSEVEALNYSTAHYYSLILIGIAFVILYFLHYLNKSKVKVLF